MKTKFVVTAQTDCEACNGKGCPACDNKGYTEAQVRLDEVLCFYGIAGHYRVVLAEERREAWREEKR